jgi:hypothetical protein
VRQEIWLEPLDQRHRHDVEDLVADPEVLRYTRIPEPPPDEFARAWIAGYESGRGDGTREGFAAVEPDQRLALEAENRAVAEGAGGAVGFSELAVLVTGQRA